MIRARIRMGMVGGGEGAFIGDIHRMAARLDGQIELVCGAFSRDAENCRRTAASLGLAPERAYESYEAMFVAEAALPADVRMQFVAIVTPNHLHLPVALAALKHGFHVMSDKPATLNLAEAVTLEAAIKASGCHYGLTHTYLGYPLVRQARDMIAAGEIGAVRRISVEYPQGWLSAPLEGSGNKQADWRTDPARAGLGGALGDIGTHASSLAEYITGDRISHVCADLRAVVPGRRLDDDVAVLFQMEQGAHGSLMASQISAGEENGLWIRISGEKGTLEWHQMAPNELILRRPGAPVATYHAGAEFEYLTLAARRACRTPSGHPEGYIEAFANLYRDFASIVRGDKRALDDAPLPGIELGLSAMAFVEAVVKNAAGDEKWTDIGALVTAARRGQETDR
ncbi:Gfo/Idh/MocA family protein [Gimibacter soli]|uniref:Gfo/Idh/MocA family oxidoreductase n=1 Tax=Gimibacter soli TaxID=3024400 RepID=A0AAE9XUF2_9PROT|nr:Gfo/Idh/MocA family oxidoreductase [Gimibacter soli]WCL55221.1 Gfo/Idh/MocA family oxidoreductase [Gimibacter soli]